MGYKLSKFYNCCYDEDYNENYEKIGYREDLNDVNRTCKYCRYTEPNLSRSIPCICCCGYDCGHQVYFAKHKRNCPQTTCSKCKKLGAVNI